MHPSLEKGDLEGEKTPLFHILNVSVLLTSVLKNTYFFL